MTVKDPGPKVDQTELKKTSIEASTKTHNYKSLERPHIQYEEELSQKASRKMKENPMVPIGMVGFFAAAAYGIHNFRNRPKNLSPSLYVLRFRVYAQSIAVGSMAAGIAYTMLRDKYQHKDDPAPQPAGTSKKH